MKIYTKESGKKDTKKPLVKAAESQDIVSKECVLAAKGDILLVVKKSLLGMLL